MTKTTKPEPVEAAVVAEATEEPKPPERRTHEVWAEQNGFLPAFSGVSRVREKGIENPKYWNYAAAKALRGWVIGFEITEQEFDAAVIEAAGVAIG